MPYRDAVATPEETLETYDILTSRGAEAVGLLAAVSIIFLVVLGVSVFAGTPREVAPWVWTFPVGAVVFAVPAIWLWRKRRRQLLIVRAGPKVRLTISPGTELTFPLKASGSQMVQRVNGIPIHHVHLKLVDGDGGAILLHEARGAIHGKQDGWFVSIDDAAPATSYDVTSLGDVQRIRSRIEEINEAEAADVV